MVAAGLGGLVLLTNRTVLEAVRRRPVRVVPGDRGLPEEPAGHRRRGGVERLPADGVLPARRDLDDRRGHAARPYLQRWLQRRRPWKVTIAVNAVIMTLFLWHMTAYLGAVLVLWPLGLAREHDSTAAWWLQRPLILGVSGLFLLGLIAVFGRFERHALTCRDEFLAGVLPSFNRGEDRAAPNDDRRRRPRPCAGRRRAVRHGRCRSRPRLSLPAAAHACRATARPV